VKENTQQGHIVVDKVTDPRGAERSFTFNPSWGSSFGLTDGDTPHNSGPLSPGTYSVTETVPIGWELTGVFCTDESDPASIALDAGETVTCTFTNTQRASITVEKQTVPDGATQLFDFTGDIVAQLGDGDTASVTVEPGVYSVTETVPDGWDLTGIVCDDEDSSGSGSTATFNVDAGEDVTCTFTNTGQPAYTFEKFINGDDADTLEEAVNVQAGDTLTFTYMLTNTGNITITWVSLTDNVFGDLSTECGLPIDIPVGEAAACDILRDAESHEQGQENIGTSFVEGLEEQTDPAWYRTSGQTPVELLYFRALGTGSAIRVEWGTAAEIDMSGYYIYRAELRRFGLAERLAFRIARGSYSTYEYLDKNVQPGKMYWYWLVSVETDGTAETDGPVQASMIASAPVGGSRIFLPFLSRGS
jgi:plastocyanin